MGKHDTPVVLERQAPPGKVWIRFTTDCIHKHLPMKAGDEICDDIHWAESIEFQGSGHRITHQPVKE